MSSTKRAWLAVTAIVCLAAAGAGLYLYRLQRPLPESNAGKAPEILSHLPADAPAIAYIDVAALGKSQDSPLAAILGLSSSGPGATKNYQDFVRDTGFDYTRDLDRVAMAFWPAILESPPASLAENLMVTVADGRFDQQKIKAYALRSGRAVTRGTESLYLVPGNPPVWFEFLARTRIALSSGTGAENLLTTSPPSLRDTATQARIDRVAGAPIFAVARTDNLPASFYDSLRSSPQLESMARTVQGLTLAGRLDGDLIHVTLDAECDSLKSSTELATLVDGLRIFGSLALADPKTRRQMTKEQFAFLETLINRVKVSHQDRWVRLTLDITPAMLGDAGSRSASLR